MVSLRLRRLREAPWRDLVALTSEGFVFRVAARPGAAACFEGLSWSGFFVCQNAPSVERVTRHLALNRAVIHALRMKRGRR